jgi:hypothetical protein
MQYAMSNSSAGFLSPRLDWVRGATRLLRLLCAGSGDLCSQGEQPRRFIRFSALETTLATLIGADISNLYFHLQGTWVKSGAIETFLNWNNYFVMCH